MSITKESKKEHFLNAMIIGSESINKTIPYFISNPNISSSDIEEQVTTLNKSFEEYKMHIEKKKLQLFNAKYYTGWVTDPKTIGNILEYALINNIKCSLIYKKKWFKKTFGIVLAGEYDAIINCKGYFKEIEPSPVEEVDLLIRSYQK